MLRLCIRMCQWVLSKALVALIAGKFYHAGRGRALDLYHAATAPHNPANHEPFI